MKNALKILYILVAGIGVFFINEIFILLGVIGLHLILFFLVKNAEKSLKFLWKVKWFIVIIFLFQALSFSGEIPLLKIKKWVLTLSYDGLYEGAIMACKLISMLLITQVVRLSMKKEEFVVGMTKLGLSKSNASIIDQIMSIVVEQKDQKKTKSGSGSGGGKGKGKGRQQENDESDVQSKDVLLKGKVGNLPSRILDKINFAKDKFANDPNAIVASSALSVTLIRMVKIAPGFPLAPGHKNLLLMPVMIHGIMKADKRFAGTQIGFISGILHFSMGFGKYGPLGIIQFALMGFILDLLFKLPINTSRIWFLMFAGGIGGFIRISSELLLALVLGVPNSFFLIYLPYVISQVAFGAASGLVTKSLIKQKTT
jgi:hypothetical protein